MSLEEKVIKFPEMFGTSPLITIQFLKVNKVFALWKIHICEVQT